MPKEYEDYRESVAIVETEAVELELLNARVSDALDQFFVTTATWGIDSYEVDCGIIPDALKPIDQRRSVVKSKLRGAGVTTKSLIENVAEAYSNGDVEVTEDNPNYNVIIKFVGTLGIPPNMDDLERSIRDIIPAHLQYTLEYRFVTYSALNATYANYDAVVAGGLTYAEILVTE
ncbi:MAG TPA: putative phage tail protein [Ignavibacteriales bacterium]|nr:putative phage tail protein [Ignavibacteriales bacterium]